MNDCITRNARRIYIRNLPPTDVSDEVQELFSRHGIIKDLFLQKNFGFIEYETEEMAKSAIAVLNGQFHFGRKLSVQIYKVRSELQREREERDRERDRSPIWGDNRFNEQKKRRNEPPRDLEQRNFIDGPGVRTWRTRGFENNGTDRDDYMHAPKGGFSTRGFPPNNPEPRMYQRNTFETKRGGFAGNRGGNTHHRDDNSFNRHNSSLPVNTHYRDDNSFNAPAVHNPSLHINKAHNERCTIEPHELPDKESSSQRNPIGKCCDEIPNDIEIIISDENILDYGEVIEGRLKTLGYSVDILFPNKNASLEIVVDNITNRGTLYAVIITNEHRFNRNLTLYFLQGETQEFRDVKLEEAIRILDEQHECYKRKVMALRERLRIPAHIRRLMEMEMSEMRVLTDKQYDELVLYFTLKKKSQPSPQPVAPLPVPPPSVLLPTQAAPLHPLVKENISIPTQQDQLATRILDILNKPQTSHVSQSSISSIRYDPHKKPFF